jgi:hypothetical protein
VAVSKAKEDMVVELAPEMPVAVVAAAVITGAELEGVAAITPTVVAGVARASLSRRRTSSKLCPDTQAATAASR